MARKQTTSIPEPIARLQGQLEEFRRTRPRRTKLPESLWDAATELARQHGVQAVAQPLRLDYMGLKKRLGAGAERQANQPKPIFVELSAPPAGTRPACLIELESTRGSKMRIHWPAGTAPDWTTLLRAWRDAEV